MIVKKIASAAMVLGIDFDSYMIAHPSFSQNQFSWKM